MALERSFCCPWTFSSACFSILHYSPSADMSICIRIKRQTNPEAFRGRGVLRIVADEGMGLYRGAGWTAARNAPGSFALFGGSAFTKEYILKLEDFSSATWGQNAIASVMGSVASLVVSQPIDLCVPAMARTSTSASQLTPFFSTASRLACRTRASTPRSAV